MNTNLSEIISILDRSGSMSGLEAVTISGYNGFLKSQKEKPGLARITTVLFDNYYEVIHNGVDIHLVKPLTCNEYFTRGSTALLDAIGKTINDVGRRLSQMAEEERPGKVIVVITTDGMENSSREFSWTNIQNMISHQQDKYNWEFIFLGANIDVDEVAEELGIEENNIAEFNANVEDVDTMYHCLNNFVNCRLNNEMDTNLKESFDEARKFKESKQ